MKISKIKICPTCGAEFDKPIAKFCCIECRDKFHFNEKQAKLREGVENEDYVVDRWNGYVTPRIFGRWMKYMHPDRTLDEYKSEFPDAPLQSRKDRESIMKTLGGQHMKTEKYRKMFSEKFKGKNNPNHKSRTTEEERKSRSPFSKKFYESRGIDDSVRQDFIKDVSKTIVHTTQLEYYLNKGLSEDDARKALSDRQRTFTLDSCIKKYGEEEGTRIYNERQRKWSKKIEMKYKNGDFTKIPYNLIGCHTSKLEQDFVNDLVLNLGIDINECHAYNSAKNQLRLQESKTDIYFFDFCYNNKIIEFNGDFWHYNPKRYKADDYFDIIGKSASEKWKFDAKKIDSAKKHGYDILVIWESDYLEDRKSVIKKCVDFLCNE